MADSIWHELEFSDELDAEITRMYAIETAAGTLPPDQAVGVPSLRRCRDEVAIEHGAADWADLVANVVDGRLWGAIPIAWIEASCERLARARAWQRARTLGTQGRLP